MIKKQPMTLDKLAQITAGGFLELNDKINGVKTELKTDIKELKTNIKELKTDVDTIHKDIFNFERILMTEVERNDRQDLRINQL